MPVSSILTLSLKQHKPHILEIDVLHWIKAKEWCGLLLEVLVVLVVELQPTKWKCNTYSYSYTKSKSKSNTIVIEKY